jgi:hypothetical protein
VKASEAMGLLARVPDNPADENISWLLRRNGLFSGETADFPLLYETPIFLINGVDSTCPFWMEFPSDILPPKDVTNICFVIDFLDYARFRRGYSLDDLAHLVERIESKCKPRQSKRRGPTLVT